MAGFWRFSSEPLRSLGNSSLVVFAYILMLITLLVQLGCSNAENAAQMAAKPAANRTPLDDPQLKKLVADTLDYNLKNRLMSAERNAAWQVLHGIIAYGYDLPLEVNAEKKSALDYLLKDGELSGWILYPGTALAEGRTGVRAHVEAGGYRSQGHVDQWLAIFSQVDVPIDAKVSVAGKEHSIADWIDQSLLDVPNNPLEEYSWTLISSVYYRPEKTKWTGIDGTEIDLETMVAFEAEQDINESACGGSHRLMALAKAVNYAKERNLSEKPAFQMAKQTLEQALLTMMSYQNSDGSLSANYFERPGASADLGLMISATGHQIEVAAYALDEEELKAEWLQRAVVRFCEMLEAAKNQPVEAGGLYHGLKGLRIYHDRRFGKWAPSESPL